MKLHFPKSWPWTYPEGQHLWMYFLNKGDIYEASRGVVGADPSLDDDAVYHALMDHFLAEGWIDQYDFDLINDPEDGPPRGYYLEVDGPYIVGATPELPVAGVAKAQLDQDVETINAHRKRIGAAPIDLSAGWTPQELHDMADQIRTRGRTRNALKHKLLE